MPDLIFVDLKQMYDAISFMLLMINLSDKNRKKPIMDKIVAKK